MIIKAVIHVLDRDSSEPLLNEFEMEITEDIDIFLNKHITRGLNDDETRKARFKEGRNIISEVCNRMNLDASYFLEGSKEIARQLFKAMKTNSTISSTDLVVCLYEDDDIYHTAILKMDYSTSYIHEIEVVDSLFKISIKKQEVSLPGIGQKIQKCAFALGDSLQRGYDLMVLDNQINHKETEEPIAQFFLQTFLNAELVVDNKVNTKMLKKETENWIKAKAKEGEPKAEEIRDFVNRTIREEEEVDLNRISRLAFENQPDLHEDYMSNMKEKGLAEEKFSVDREWVDKKLQKIRIKTDNQVEIILSYEDYNNREKFEIIKNSNGTRTILIKEVMNLFEK